MSKKRIFTLTFDLTEGKNKTPRDEGNYIAEIINRNLLNIFWEDSGNIRNDKTGEIIGGWTKRGSL